MLDLERYYCNLTCKSENTDTGSIEGYASVFDVVDLQDDIVERNAFAKTINERVPSGKVKLMVDHNWSVDGAIGVITEAREDTVGLYFKARLSAVQKAQDTRQKVLEGIINTCSVGINVLKSEFQQSGELLIRRIKEIKLYEISLCPFPANEFTVVMAKNVVPFQDLPLAALNTAWDAEGAEARVRAWCKADGEPNERYKKAFLLIDRVKANMHEGYKLQIVDVIDGHLKAVPNAIMAAANAIDTISDSDKISIKNHLARYYNKMRREFDDNTIVAPWTTSSKEAEPARPLTYNLQIANILKRQHLLKGM